MTPEVARDLRQRLSQAPPAGVVSVYLFGSHATGHAHRESDVDVGVLLRRDVYPTDRERFEARLRLAAEQALGRAAIDVVILNERAADPRRPDRDGRTSTLLRGR